MTTWTPLPVEGVQVAGQGRDERLALAGAHLGDLAVVQDHAADQLDVVMAHPERAHRGLAGDRKRLGQEVVERRALVELALELGSHGLELGVALGLHRVCEVVDLGDDRLELLELALVPAPEDALDNTHG